MSKKSSLDFIHPGRLFVDKFGPVQSIDDVLHYAQFLRQEAEISSEPPIDLMQIYAKFHILPPKRAPLPNQQGLLLDSERGVILINDDDPMARQRFTEGHELVELLFAALPTGKGWAFRQTGIFKHSVKEQLCNQGAAELLMPRASFEPRVKRLGVSFSTGRKLADEYQVSVTAALVQMARVAPGKHAIVLWRIKNKPTEMRPAKSPNQLSLFGEVEEVNPPKKLRVEWSLAGPNTAYIPADKSVPEDTSIYMAWLDNVFTTGEDHLALGSTSGKFKCENQPFGTDDERCVISLLHLPGDTDCLPQIDN